jgi:hypothetical protein
MHDQHDADTELLALAARWAALEAESSDETDAAVWDEQFAIEQQMLALTATTVPGLAAKARLLQSLVAPWLEERDDVAALQALNSLLRDLGVAT